MIVIHSEFHAEIISFTKQNNGFSTLASPVPIAGFTSKTPFLAISAKEFSDSNFPRDPITLLASPYRISVVLFAALKKNLDGSKNQSEVHFTRSEFHFMGLGFRVLCLGFLLLWSSEAQEFEAIFSWRKNTHLVMFFIRKPLGFRL